MFNECYIIAITYINNETRDRVASDNKKK